MAKARALVKRRKAVSNICKITRTMQLIATARFQQALVRAQATRPYADKITELVEELGAAGEQVEHPLLRENPADLPEALLVITSNRGLCGGYNSSLLRVAQGQLAAADQAGRPVELHAIGKKGVAYFRFLKRELAKAITKLGDMPTFADIEPMARQFMDAYAAGQYSSVHVVYMDFESVVKQVPTCVQLLPLRHEAGEEEAAEPSPANVQYDFSPPPVELLAELLPATVNVRLFQCFVNATVSEQVARMVAMKSATDAATDMIKFLSSQYNRARQTQITLELLDIVGGAEALK